MNEQEKKAREQFATDVRDIGNFVGATFNKVKGFNKVYGGEDNPYIDKYCKKFQEALNDFQMMLNFQAQFNVVAMNQKDPEPKAAPSKPIKKQDAKAPKAIPDVVEDKKLKQVKH